MFEVSIISLDDRIIINRLLLYYASDPELTKLLSTIFSSSQSFLIIDFMNRFLNKHNESNINLYLLTLFLVYDVKDAHTKANAMLNERESKHKSKNQICL